MKKTLITIILFSITTLTFAKKVKFACDMTGIPVLATGMHISGDFQTVAGFAGGDWNSASTPLTQEAGTEIYSIIVDIPAFTKYEYKFVNGDHFYEAEFVPEFSRVGYNFNDNRWLYVDSLANDTTFIGAIVFAANAPAGLFLVRYYVNMQNEIVSNDGVHLAGSFQGFNPATTYLYSFAQNIHEVISYVAAGTYAYKFYNGNNSGAAEAVPSACAVNGNREVAVNADVLLGVVCFASCDPCVTGIADNDLAAKMEIFPNPAQSYSQIKIGNAAAPLTVLLQDVTGRIIREYNNVQGALLVIERGNLQSGIYFVHIKGNSVDISTAKLVFE
ncbi:MAG: T9SS type A sorting domain-containing protein [Bacteroidetes bacterium]|nr:T9SS type A sorting domain-containing protein [Bacteroidota bacterium]